MFSLFSYLFAFCLISSVAQAADILDTVRVLGGTSGEELSKPSSVHVVNDEKLVQQQQTDVNRVLQQVPGVYVQEEDAHGLRPNIGLRGTHPHRSRKVVLLEDGILIGPAPYSAPAAYYTPSMLKIETLEIFKGLAAVPYGPNSIGGAINYVTRAVPQRSHRDLDLALGDFNYRKSRISLAEANNEHGILLEASQISSDGFKKIDSGVKEGFLKKDIMLKGQHLINTEKNQILSWKLGYADEDSKETYLGLTLDDFIQSPYRRYSASERDQMLWQHQQYQLGYKLNPKEDWGLWGNIYYHQFHRNWSRLNNFTGSAPSISAVLADPGSPSHQAYYDILTGKSDSSGLEDLVIANNNRYFISQGLQLGSINFISGDQVQSQIKTQLRIHQDEIKRRHTEDIFAMEDGRLRRTADPRALGATNFDQSKALTLSLEDELHWEKWKWTLAARMEQVDYRSLDEISFIQEGHRENVFVPGIGALFQATEKLSYLGGVNKGTTLVGPNRQESQKPEESINAELGIRFQDTDTQFFAELIGFAADYSNIKGTCSFSSGCTNNSLEAEFDGGRAEIRGFEGRLAKLFSYQQAHFPVSFNFTVTQARFSADTESSNPEWGIGSIQAGDPLPYIPSSNYSLNLGTQYKQWNQELVLQWTGTMADQSLAENRAEIPAHGVVDWTASYQWVEGRKLYARVDNVLDNEYLVSLRPFGARPGKDRSVQLGIKYLF